MSDNFLTGNPVPSILHTRAIPLPTFLRPDNTPPADFQTGQLPSRIYIVIQKTH